ncbi:aldo/keto reductase [Celerinatantimonas diazotrophica]|uniref:Diketogulonate reductase-like aldo/keto reductase n=1 Tax=Celerinatantimonas diazotrophica TaxID=412034 RepID=A0A4R1K3S0_9GAMM|nr:aldo/keto reductase [Celerinatantimonas diazotrophica]TCK58547.1 diketogulonate reductase-like aldo/keto reductase [Celerinatantimonas diazotrophica]CAG9297176.1 2,5-diketo-D-gluconic acid reductase B [Celerinatantimonas diazotrophica]
MSISRTIQLPDGAEIPALGQGTWWMGDDADLRHQEIEALRRGVELGLTVIDSAEMYGDGKSEALVGEAIAGCRESVFLVSKFLPNHAAGKELQQSLEQSLQRLNTDYLDLYLLHWRGHTPLQQTVQDLEQLCAEGVIKRWGVSNFDVCDMQELLACEGGENCQVNQVLYHLGSRGVEFDLKPFLVEHHIPLIAYSPLAQAGRLREEVLASDTLRQVADEHDADPFQIMLAWSIRDHHTLAIPKSANVVHVERNAKAGLIELSETQLQMLDQAFMPPSHKMPLDII